MVVMGRSGLKDVCKCISGWFRKLRKQRASHGLLDLSGRDLCLSWLSTEKACETRGVSTKKRRTESGSRVASASKD